MLKSNILNKYFHVASSANHIASSANKLILYLVFILTLKDITFKTIIHNNNLKLYFFIFKLYNIIKNKEYAHS